MAKSCAECKFWWQFHPEGGECQLALTVMGMGYPVTAPDDLCGRFESAALQAAEGGSGE